MELNKKAAYLQGLVDGLGIDDTTKEGKIIKAMSALLGEMAEVIEGRKTPRPRWPCRRPNRCPARTSAGTGANGTRMN